MQLFIVAVGKNRGSAEHRLAEDWLGRLPEAGGIHEVESKLPAGAKRAGDEAIRLLRAVPPGAALAIQVLKGAIACHSGMATFAEAGVSDG